MRRILCSLLLASIAAPARAVSVATVGDSFADSLYNALRARPDLLQRYGVELTRWSRPIVGLTRDDYFDYTAWLRDSPVLGAADICLVQIGSNDMQSIPLGKQQFLFYGTPQWKEAYAVRTRELALVLTQHRCGQVVWLLQPGFEKQDAMACHRELINEVQGEALRLGRTRVMELATSEAAYGPDKTHFNRAYLLQLGPSLFHLVDTASQIAHGGCLSCHGNLESLAREPEPLPLRSWHRDLAVPVWAPDRVGVQCRLAAVRTRKIVHRRQAR